MDNEIVKVEKEPTAIKKVSDTLDIEKDYNYSKDTLEEILESGKTAIKEALLLAQASDSPRAYEVLGGLIKTVGDVNDKLLGLQEKVKRLEETEQKENGFTTNNNAVFIGNTSELLEKLFKRNE